MPSAPSPVPGVSGEIPHTIGPDIAAGPVMASSSKNDRSTSPVDRRDHRNSVGAPARRRRRASAVSPRTDGGSAAASKIMRIAGIAARAYRR